MSQIAHERRRRLVTRGIAWNTLYQIVESGLAFAAMLVLVRVIEPAEYGRFGAALGVLTLLNAFNASTFVAHALQLPDEEEPDWSLHWCAGFYIQSFLFLLCNAIAGLCWLGGDYRALAPLLHLASVGLLLDWPAQVRIVMLRRELDFGRMKLLFGCSVVIKLGVAVVVALAGGGAYALVLGSNVVTPLPLAADLIVFHGWRPRAQWWRWPDWVAYRPALRFGFQRAGSALLAAGRGALEAVVLPQSVGYAAIGLLGRARVLLGTTVGKVTAVLEETAYPLLPRYAAEAGRYARQATLFVQAVLLVGCPGILYIALEGRALSRLLYGERWVGADPLIWPAAVAALGLVIFAVASDVLLGASRLRASFLIEVASATLSIPMIAVTWLGGSITAYAWAVAIGQCVMAVAALMVASPLLARGWVRNALIPPAVAGLLAAVGVAAIQQLDFGWPGHVELAVTACAFAAALVVVLRGLFPAPLALLLGRMPGGGRVSAWLRLPAAPRAPVAP
jgi:O-antigen/teichoic acid export membrane protein